jgi:hypothetical protein
MLAANSVYFGGTNGAEFVLNNPDYSLFYNLPRPFYFRDQSNSPYFSEIEVNALGLTGRGHFWLLSNNAISVGNTAQQPQRITNLATPTGGSDAATKAYVDGKATGGSAGFPVTGTSASITNTNDGIININATNLIKIAANSNNNLGISNNGSYFVNLLGGQLVLYSDASPSGLYTKSNANIVSGNEAAVSLGHSASNATTNIIGRAVYANATALMQLQAPDFDLGSDSPIKVMNASWNALQRIKIADPTEADDGVTLGYAKSNFSRYQDAVSLTNPTQAEIDALGRCLRGQLEIILTDPDNNTLYINGFYWHAAVTQAPAIVIRIRSSRNNGIYCLGNKCITFCYSQAEGPVTIPYFIWSGDSLTFADTAAYPNSMVTITGNCNCSVGSVQTTGDHWAFATLRISLNGMLTLSSNVNIATLIPTGKLAIGEAFTGTIGTVTIGSYNAPLIIDNRPSHELDTFSRTGGGGFPINGDGVSLTNPSAGRFLLNVSNSTATKAAIEIDTGQNTKRLVLRSTDLATSANSYISLTESLVNIYGNNTLQLIGENLVFFQSSSDYAGLAISSGKVTLSAPDTSPRININNTVTSVFGKQTIIGTTTADQPVVVGRMENDGSYLGYQRISAADPVGANDLVTKQYADANYGGGFPFVGSGVRIMNTQEAVVSIERRIGGVFLPVFHSEAGYTSLSEPASDAYLNLGADVELGGSYLDLLGRGSVTIRSSGSVSLNAYQKARFEATESQTLISGVEVDQFRPSATIRLDNEGINIAGVDPVVGIKAPVIKMGPLGLSLVSPNQNNYSVDYSHLTFYRSSASLAYNGIGSTGRKGFYVQADLAYIMSDVAIAMQSDGNTASRQRVKAADPIDVDDLVTKSYADAHYISTGTDANGYSITIDAQGIHLKAPQNQSVLISGSGIYLNGTVYINDVQQ